MLAASRQSFALYALALLLEYLGGSLLTVL